MKKYFARSSSIAFALAVSTVGLLSGAADASDNGTSFGASVLPDRSAGQTYAQAVVQAEGKYGRLGAIRYFEPGAPKSWANTTTKLTDHDAVISWNMAPASVNAGNYDAALQNWFATAPTDRVTWWNYFHEPEDNVERGQFTAAQFVVAYQRIARMASAVGNPNLHSTLILMCWTANPHSGRDWNAYFPGNAYVDVMGWDCYDHHKGPGYVTPNGLFKHALAASIATGLPLGIAELGTLIQPGDDDGSGRAAWLTACAQYLYDHGAAYVTYYDTIYGGYDFRLKDAPSKSAWNSVVSDQNPY